MASFSRPSRLLPQETDVIPRVLTISLSPEKAPANAPGGAKHVLADSHGFFLDVLLMYLALETHSFLEIIRSLRLK
ncbi:hypothetical protein NDU88_004836 [Pleurodeles waltl]|uniref:Uncharacterized protein n=1 Tax=Pleurodeles waltl TaxID=8319 RepID=A0AAV7V692_PLEWA|nr:hypothetical protein NDU88_004836 [Pleurodeles waltl]